MYLSCRPQEKVSIADKINATVDCSNFLFNFICFYLFCRIVFFGKVFVQMYAFFEIKCDICIIQLMKMNYKKFVIMAAAVLAAVSLPSCKKDKDGTTTSYAEFSGTLKFNVPSFVGKGESLTVTPRGLEKESVNVGYYWTASPLYEKKDTTKAQDDPASATGAYKLNIKDTLCTVTLTCNAFAKGYYTKTYSSYITIVDPAFGQSLTKDGVSEDDLNITDARDGKKYYYRKIGNRDWFLRNVAYGEKGESFLGCPVMDDVIGRYYTWNDAQTVCPSGWRVPSDSDWLDLAAAGGYAGKKADESYIGIAGALMVDAYFNSEKMWEYWPAVKITNKTGFCAIPSGYGNLASENVFTGGMEYAVYWSSESYDDYGVYRMINMNKPDFMREGINKDNFLASVRCVRDAE